MNKLREEHLRILISIIVAIFFILFNPILFSGSEIPFPSFNDNAFFLVEYRKIANEFCLMNPEFHENSCEIRESFKVAWCMKSIDLSKGSNIPNYNEEIIILIKWGCNEGPDIWTIAGVTRALNGFQQKKWKLLVTERKMSTLYRPPTLQEISDFILSTNFAYNDYYSPQFRPVSVVEVRNFAQNKGLEWINAPESYLELEKRKEIFWEWFPTTLDYSHDTGEKLLCPFSRHE